MGSCCRTMCYVVGSAHLILFGSTLLFSIGGFALTVYRIPIKIYDDLFTGSPDGNIKLEKTSLIMLMLAAGSIFQICMGVLLIVGVNKRRPDCILWFVCIMLCFIIISFFCMIPSVEYQLLYFFLLLSLGLYLAELVIAGKYHSILMKEIRQEEMNTPLIITEVYTPF